MKIKTKALGVKKEKYVLTRQEENLLDRLEYCRAALFTNGIIGDKWNAAIKKKIRKEKENC